MKTKLKIEHIFLEGFELSHSQIPKLQVALEVELARLCNLHGIPPSIHTSSYIHKLAIPFGENYNQNPQQIGQQAAQSIYTAWANFNEP